MLVIVPCDFPSSGALKMVFFNYLDHVKDQVLVDCTPTKQKKRKASDPEVVEVVLSTPTPTKKKRNKKAEASPQNDGVVILEEVNHVSSREGIDNRACRQILLPVEESVEENEPESSPSKKKSKKALVEGQIYREFRPVRGSRKVNEGENEEMIGHRQRVRNQNIVKVFVCNDSSKNPDVLTFWDSCNHQDHRSVEFKWSEDKKKLLGTHRTNKRVTYNGTEYKDPDFDYFLAVRGVDSSGESADQTSSGLVLEKVKIFRIRPLVNMVPVRGQDKLRNQLQTRSRVEQITEAMSKFGSKKANRNMASKTKSLSMRVDAEDVIALQSATEKTLAKELASKSGADDGGGTSDLIPPRKENAIHVGEVYNIQDLINVKLVNLLASYVESKERLSIELELVKKYLPAEFKIAAACWDTKDGDNEQNLDTIKAILTSDPSMKEKILIAHYIDLLIRVYHLKSPQLRLQDPMKVIEHKEMKTFLMEAFIESTKETDKKRSFVKHFLTDKTKDRILITVFILLLKLSNYGKIKVLDASKELKLSAAKVRSIGQMVGCHSDKGKVVDQLVFKVPLYQMPMNSKGGRRQRH